MSEYLRIRYLQWAEPHWEQKGINRSLSLNSLWGKHLSRIRQMYKVSLSI